MAVRTRINPKTGKIEYKARYYFMRDGKKRDSETAWFLSEEKALEEAKTQKELKEKADRHNVNQRRDKKLVTAYEEFIEHLQIQADKEITNTDKKELSVAKSMIKNHMPIDIQDVRIKDLSIYTWRTWLSYINSKDEIGGGYIRLCRLNMTKFNTWLSQHGYYLDEFQEETFDIGIRKTKIKNSMVGNRERSGQRNLLSILDIEEITGYYEHKEGGLGVFRNFFFYTLFHVLFFSGVRPEELVGLQWKFIDMRDGYRTIAIRNAISNLERQEHALERVVNGQYRTKNPTSVRTIPIFDFYYELLQDYKESYRYEYNLTEKEMEECFVFPTQKDPHIYMRGNKILDELKKVLREVGLPNTDLQMFRHSCATFLIMPSPNGLGYTEERVKDYFGHQDTDMLNKVYARLSQEQKAERMRVTFKDIYKPSEVDERTEEERMKEELLKRIYGDNDKEKMNARKNRIFAQIKNAKLKGKKTYYYLQKDEEIIEMYIKENGKAMEFIKEV